MEDGGFECFSFLAVPSAPWTALGTKKGPGEFSLIKEAWLRSATAGGAFFSLQPNFASSLNFGQQLPFATSSLNDTNQSDLQR